MAIAPITGMLRKRFIVDLTCSLSLATAGAYTFWYGYHLKAGTLTRPFSLFRYSSC
ncbi:cytochrome-c oxidase subunit VIIa [Armillaria mellea]|nr:cytochrome-c oxidase subunit VIIa [Armillaria mellea]